MDALTAENLAFLAADQVRVVLHPETVRRFVF